MGRTQSVKKWEKTQQGHGCSWRGRQLQHFVSSARLSSRSSSCLESLVICYTWEGSAVFLALTKQCSSHPSSQKSSSISPTLQISAHEVKFFIVITGIRKKNLIVQSNVGVRRWDQPWPGVGVRPQILIETSLHLLLAPYRPSSTFAKLRQARPLSLHPSGLERLMPWRELLVVLLAAVDSLNDHHQGELGCRHAKHTHTSTSPVCKNAAAAQAETPQKCSWKQELGFASWDSSSGNLKRMC